MKTLKVNLWGREIGRLAWDQATRRTFFMFNPDYSGNLPDIAPFLAPADTARRQLPVYGDERPLYQGLPPFIADSLPDSWGNALFDKWVRNNRIPRNKITPLYKLMFIGTRGMGALEYEPCASDLNHSRAVDIKTLHDLSLQVLHDRDSITVDAAQDLTLQTLLAVGTSAGGRQMKAIIAIDSETGEIRSGQTDGLAGCEYHILKFGSAAMPLAEIEAAYYMMATAAGIEMEECRLLPVEGVSHFLTKRFDRKNGRKIHVQTLAAMNPEARSYEDLISTCRELSVSEQEVGQMFARMVFNVLANNTDDHNKNFSFLLEEDGKWRIAPAYDITFIFNATGTGPNIERRLSVGGKTAGITKADLLDFAKRNDIRNPVGVIDRVAAAVGDFSSYADMSGVGQPWRGMIRKWLDDNLSAFGYRDDAEETDAPFCDSHGRKVTSFAVAVNSKGHYEVTAVVDGRRRRRFVRPNMSLFAEISRHDICDLPVREKIRLAEALFPEE